MITRISVVQMVSSRIVDVNLKRAEALILDAASGYVDAIFLPENFAALGHENPNEIGCGEVNESGPIRTFLSEMACRSTCWIFAGTLPIASRIDGSRIDDGRVRAASIVYDSSGNEVTRYDKIHMFDAQVADNQGAYLESRSFEPGNSIVVAECPIGTVGLSVCYDLRFPELYRELLTAGATAFAIPSAFTETTGSAHFELLMRARAVENTCFTIASCQGGVHDSGRRTYGHSMVVDPWGEVIGRLGKGEGVLTVELDLVQQRNLRKAMPFQAQRRL